MFTSVRRFTEARPLRVDTTGRVLMFGVAEPQNAIEGIADHRCSYGPAIL